MINITDLNISQYGRVEELGEGTHYIEDVCRGYGDWFNQIHLKLAIINLVFYIIFPILEKYSDKPIGKLNINDKDIWFYVRDIKNLFIGVFMFINFFYIGYWFQYHNLGWLRELPIIGRLLI